MACTLGLSAEEVITDTTRPAAKGLYIHNGRKVLIK